MSAGAAFHTKTLQRRILGNDLQIVSLQPMLMRQAQTNAGVIRCFGFCFLLCLAMSINENTAHVAVLLFEREVVLLKRLVLNQCQPDLLHQPLLFHHVLSNATIAAQIAAAVSAFCSSVKVLTSA